MHNHKDKYGGGRKCCCRFDHFLEPRLLLLLREKDSYGYELAERLNEISFLDQELEEPTIYRTLRDMEKEKLVESRWVIGESGPPKRVYKITPAGEERLKLWVSYSETRKKFLESFINHYYEKKSQNDSLNH